MVTKNGPEAVEEAVAWTDCNTLHLYSMLATMPQQIWATGSLSGQDCNFQGTTTPQMCNIAYADVEKNVHSNNMYRR
jgi:hypothetical protein